MRRADAATHDDRDEAGTDAIARGFRAAIAEAVRFMGATMPNPPVGCAILDRNGVMLAVAAHHRAGELHAEALALQICRQTRTLDRATTLIVTLEPCNHTGRTGPCTEAILASPIRTVWIGVADPNPGVVGGGERRLQQAGLDVFRCDPASGIGRDCAALIAPFAMRANTMQLGAGRPWITVKQALDAEGSMIPPKGAKTFTGQGALRLAHRLRRATDAIVTGMGTILADSPHFTVRHVPDHDGRKRFLAVVDRDAGLPAAYRHEAEQRGFALRTAADLPSLLRLLANEGVLWALVEGGPRLLAEIERRELWDDWLTIRHDAPDHDRVVVHTRRAETPLRLIPGIEAAALPVSAVTEEMACFPVS